MDSARTKTVEVEGVKYLVRRMTPFTGSCIWHRLMHAVLLLQQEQPERATEAAAEPEPEPEVTPDVRLRALCGMAFMKMSFVELREVQQESMKVLSSYNTADLPIPVMTDTGQWTPGTEALQDNPFLVTKLTVEVLLYNLVGFLAATGS